jgi:hypothetical protein
MPCEKRKRTGIKVKEKNGKDRRRNGGGEKYMRGEGRKSDYSRKKREPQ